MKNKIKKQFELWLIFSSFVFVSGCATHDRFYHVDFHDDIVFIPKEKHEVKRTPSNEALASCGQIVKNFFKHLGEKSGKEVKALKGMMRFPSGVEPKEGKHIQYGFESEYVHEEARLLLQQYMPSAPLFTKGKEEWLKMSHEERLEFIEKNQKKIFPYRQSGKMVKIAENKELFEALPDSIVYDAGNFEIVMPPHDTVEEIAAKIKIINKNVGVGSMQVMISNPLERATLLSTKEMQFEESKRLLGYYNFMNDFDTLGKLHAGYMRYLENPEQQVVKSFSHPWLGPMTALKHSKLKKHIHQIVEGRNYTSSELEEMSFIVTSHKFVGGLSFRPDVAYKHGRIASEVRDCHKSVDCLENRLLRETYFLMKGRDEFKKFSELEAFDTSESYKVFSSTEKAYLRLLFPKYGHFTQVELEIYRNFSYPFRDWSKHVEVFNVPGLKEQIEEAQGYYQQQLKDIFTQLEKGTMNEEAGRRKIMGALAEFSKRSGIMDAFNLHYDELFNKEELGSLRDLKLSHLNFSPVRIIFWKAA